MGTGYVSRIYGMDRVCGRVYLRSRSSHDNQGNPPALPGEMMRLNTVIGTKAAIVATLILVAQAAVYYTGSGKEVIPAVAPWSQFPAVLGTWQSGGDVPIEQDVLDQLKPDDYLNRIYTSN